MYKTQLQFRILTIIIFRLLVKLQVAMVFVVVLYIKSTPVKTSVSVIVSFITLTSM